MRPCSCRPEETCGGTRCGVSAFLEEFYARPDAFPRPPQGTPLSKAQKAAILRAYFERPATNNPDGRCKKCAKTIREEVRQAHQSGNGLCNHANSQPVSSAVPWQPPS